MSLTKKEILTELHGNRLGLGFDDALIRNGKEIIPASNDGAAATVTGLSYEEKGNGILNKTILTLDEVVFALTDNAGTVAYSGKKLYDFPAGAILCLGALANLTVTKDAAGVDADFNGDFSVGTVTASNNATLAGTEANLIKSTAMPQAVAGATTAKGGAVNTIAALTDNSTGTAADTIAEITGAANAGSSDLAPVENAVASLAAKVNELIDALTGTRIQLLDGTTTPVDVYLNFLVDDADHDVTTTPTNLLVSGTLTLYTINLGDF